MSLKNRLAFVPLIVTLGCGTSSTSSTSSPRSYQGAGSKWTASISETAFTLTRFPTAASDAVSNLTISGTVSANSTNLFKTLTVTSATGTGAPTVGDTSYALEVPGTAFFFKPFGTVSEPIILVSSGTCPSANFESNWILGKPRSDLTVPMTTSTDVFGGATFTANSTTSSLAITTYNPITGAVFGGGSSLSPIDLTTCSNGLQRVSAGNEIFDMYFTASNNIIVKFPDTNGGQIIFGSPKQSTAVTQASIAGTYSAIVFESKSGTSSMFPAQLTIPASGDSQGFMISSVANNTVDTDGIKISNIASTTDSSATQLPAGFFRGDLNPVSGSSTSGKITCSYSTSESTKVLGCFGYLNNTGGDARRPFFILGRSR